MQYWQSAIVVSVAAVAGFSAGHQWHSSPDTAPAAPEERLAAPAARTQFDETPTQGGRMQVDALAGELVARLAPVLQQVVADAARASADGGHPIAARTATNAPLEEPAAVDPLESQQALEVVQQILNEQAATGQLSPEQRDRISAAAPKLTLTQRKQMMDQFIAAIHRGEIDPATMPPPL